MRSGAVVRRIPQLSRHSSGSIRSRADGMSQSAPMSSHAAVIRKAIRLGAPPSVAAVASDVVVDAHHRVRVRQVGSARRVFLLEPYLSAEELEGLAYRIKTLSTNEHISSVLMATDNNEMDNPDCLPSSLLDRENPTVVDLGFPPAPNHNYFVSGGYDPRSVLAAAEGDKGIVVDTALVDYTLQSLSSLSSAIQGDAKHTKIPFITMPHGALTNGGGVWLQGTYSIATPETTFKIDAGTMGLSLDPIGLSYSLPRIGWEFAQPSREYPVGMMMALTRYQAAGWDLVATGLATNFVDSPNGLSILELELSQLPPWNQQAIVKNPTSFYGDPPSPFDLNAPNRNVSVADAVQCFASTRANNSSAWSTNSGVYEADGDVSLDPDCMYLDDMPAVQSDLVDIAATFRHVFAPSNSLTEIMGQLKEISERQTQDPEEQEGIDIAGEFLRRMQAQSPLALSATHRLLQMGYEEESSRNVRDQCMKRELIVQRNLLVGKDFGLWAEYAGKDGQEFTAWSHRFVDEVTSDEVEALFQET